MLIYIVRHSKTNGNLKGILQGWIDEPLNDVGREIAVITAKALSDVKFDAAYSSPLSRAYETAEIILRYNKNEKPAIQKDNRIKEINFGEWEGLCMIPDKSTIPSDTFGYFYTDPFSFQNAPSGESVLDVCKRAGEFYQELISREELQDKTILLATHGCAVRALLRQVYEDKSDFWHGKVPKNCAVNIVEVKNGESKLIGEDLVYYDPELYVNQK